jgi:hypothetical protein
LSGAGRDPLDGDASRSFGMGDAPGSAEVHSGIAFHAPSTSDAGVAERTVSRVRDAAESAADSDLGQRARGVAGEVADRASELASRARDRVGALADRAQGALEDRGLLAKLRENPLPALGVAFAAGFLLAGGRRSSAGAPATSRAQRVRGELRGALVAGLSAGLAQGARAVMRDVGAEDGILNSVMQNIPGLGGETSAARGRRPAAGRTAYAGVDDGYGTEGGRDRGGYREPEPRDRY